MWDSNPKQRPRILMLHILNLSADAKQLCHDIPNIFSRRRHFAGNYISVSHWSSLPCAANGRFKAMISCDPVPGFGREAPDAFPASGHSVLLQ